MRKLWKQIMVVLLLLLFLGEAGMTAAAGIFNCDGCCGCCHQPRHRAGAGGQALGGGHQMATPASDAPLEAARGSCCKTAALDPCDRGEAESVVLVSTSPRMDRFFTSSSRPVAVVAPITGLDPSKGPATDPFTTALLARSTLPIYLQTAVFLC
jgi:hypothetical protein